MKPKTSQRPCYSTPPYKFAQQRNNARRRGVEWLMSFDEWWGLWLESGKWNQRGKGDGQYVMGRHGDVGPYAVGNVSIILCNENGAVRHGHLRELPIGVHALNGRFYAKRRGVWLGGFATVELAHAAYLMAAQPIARAA
jgi:hypothetical protein